MTQQRPRLAKLTRPRLHNAVAREALFTHLDGLREQRSAICVVGPPGAGKTTLIASWLDARSARGIWYQIDPGDADIATFFHYLGEAMHPFSRKGRRALPALTSEYLTDIQGFSRRYFRELYGQLPRNSIVVLDNYQEVDAPSPLHDLIANAVSEIPADQTLVVITRHDPPECYARLIANEHVGFVDWSQLKLTEAEARAIVARRAALDDAAVRALHERSGGWAAGLTLMLEERDGPHADDANLGHVFEYFAGQILRRASPRTRSFLVETSLLPNVPVSVARTLTGNDAAADILEDLYRRHLFVHRRPGVEPVYWYHALFREFLRREARAQLTPTLLDELSDRAARALEATKRFEDAFDLYSSAGQWNSSARVLLATARGLLARGRWRTLLDWLGLLPGAVFEHEPRLFYWLGMALMASNPRDSRGPLEAAYERLGRKGDSTGQALAAAAIIDAIYFEWAAFHDFKIWIEALDVAHKNASYDCVDDELRVQSSLLTATLFVAPGHPLLADSVRRIDALLDEPIDTNSRIKAASHLLVYCGTARDLNLAARVEARIAPDLDDVDATPLHRMWWNLRVGQCHTFAGRYESGERLLREAERIRLAEGLAGLRTAALLIRSFLLMVVSARRQWRSVATIAAEIEAMVDRNRPTDLFLLHQTRVRLASAQGRAERLAADTALLDATAQTGMVHIEVLGLLDWGLVLAARGDASLDRHLARIDSLVDGTCLQLFSIDAAFVRVYRDLRTKGNSRCREHLAQVLRRAREAEFSYANPLRVSPALVEVLEAALEQDVETDYVRDAIRRYRILPGENAGDRWPWPVRIRTLGRFDVLLDDAPVAFAGKAPRRVLQLLKAIVAFGVTDVPVRDLIDALWPDDEADAGYDAFTVAIGRLRKLLGAPDLVLLSGEKVSLDVDRCWVDTVAFERCTDPTSESDSPSNLFSLYRGAFLPDESDAPWVLRPRLKLRQRFLAALERQGAAFESEGEWERAAECYDHGLAVDDLAEGFYQGLMRCHLAAGRSAEGLVVFRRMRQILSVVLGIGPSPKSHTLAQRLGELAPRH